MKNYDIFNTEQNISSFWRILMKNIIQRYKKDFLILMILVVIAFISFLIIRFYYGKDSGEVQVYVDNKLVASYDIRIDDTYIVNVSDEYNEIIVKDGQVCVSRSSCKNQVCVQHSPISMVGESIICLPHKLVVQIYKGDKTQDDHALDDIAK